MLSYEGQKGCEQLSCEQPIKVFTILDPEHAILADLKMLKTPVGTKVVPYWSRGMGSWSYACSAGLFCGNDCTEDHSKGRCPYTKHDGKKVYRVGNFPNNVATQQSVSVVESNLYIVLPNSYVSTDSDYFIPYEFLEFDPTPTIAMEVPMPKYELHLLSNKLKILALELPSDVANICIQYLIQEPAVYKEQMRVIEEARAEARANYKALERADRYSRMDHLYSARKKFDANSYRECDMDCPKPTRY